MYTRYCDMFSFTLKDQMGTQWAINATSSDVKSLRTLATPDAMTPTPFSETSLTLILALGLAHFKS